MDPLNFDLQLFADAPVDETAPVDNAPADSADAGDEAQPSAATTILGAQPQPKEREGQSTEGNAGDNQQTAPAAYDFTGIVPDGMDYDEASAKAFGEVARAANLTQEQASSIASYGMKYMQDGVNAAMQQIADTHKGWADTARQELGADFDSTVAKAGTALNVLSTKIPGIRETLDETGAGNRVELIRMFAAIGELVGEDRGLAGGVNGAGKSIYPNTDFSNYN